MEENDRLFKGTLWLLSAILLASPISAQGTNHDGEDSGTVVEVERTSHVVRAEEERLLARFGTGRWRFAALVGTRTPRFFEDENRFGLGVETSFGDHAFTFVARSTEGDEGGEEIAASLRWATSLESGSELAAELTWATDDLASDGFLLGDEEEIFAGRVLYRRPTGLGLELFASESGSFDLRRGTREILDRLPRSEIFGVETLADLYVDEGRLEDAVGAAVGKQSDTLSWRLYVKSGEQTIRGVFEGDDVLGFGGEIDYRGERFEVRTELDVRNLDTPDGIANFHRGRLFVDLLARLGRFELGAGGYLQGESDLLEEIPDVYDTAGLAFGGAYELSSGRAFGLWAMAEDNAPDFQKIARLAAFYRPPGGGWEAGLGARRDELGRSNFEREETGPFAYFEGRFPGSRFELETHVGTIDGETYGRLLIRFAR